jgi:hypothetical protein
MYYPYFRGKQFELILLRNNAAFLTSNKIHPIIEPVKEDFTALSRAMKELNEKKTHCTLIVNPIAGQDPVKTDDILKLIDDSYINYSCISLGLMLHAESKTEEYIKLLQKYQNHTFSFIHCGYTKKLASEIASFKNIPNHIFIDGMAGKLYQRQFKGDGTKRILIRNGFKSQKKNAHYPPSEHFSDLHITYPEEAMDDFGDYLIVGDDYTESGGPAYAVAIHLTYLEEDDDMYIYHFISDKTDSPTDPGGKFLEALSKLVKTLDKPKSKIFNSSAINEFRDLFQKKHYPGLGYVKKLSMQHHLELIADFNKRNPKK